MHNYPFNKQIKDYNYCHRILFNTSFWKKKYVLNRFLLHSPCPCNVFNYILQSVYSMVNRHAVQFALKKSINV